MYNIIFSNSVKKEFKKLEKQVQNRIISSLKRIRIRPENYVRKLVRSKHYRLRVGDFRIILDIENKKLLILVIKVAHRKNIYK